MLELVTITGPDNDTNFESLNDYSTEYPYVEWGILYSPTDAGKAGYPSNKWLKEAYGYMLDGDKEINLSLHITGRAMHKVTSGIVAPELPRIIHYCQRVQFNYSGVWQQVEPKACEERFPLFKGKKVITQLDGVNDNLFKLYSAFNSIAQFKKLDLEFLGLYDQSAGHGVLPQSWGKPVTKPMGYAGGITPENAKEQLDKISEVAGDTPYWIDVYSGARDDEGFLDMEKVKTILEIAKPYTVEKSRLILPARFNK